jgi:hypothetical protein
MVERVNQGEGSGAIESSTVIQGGSNANRRLVDVRDAEVDLPHFKEPRITARRASGSGIDGREGSVPWLMPLLDQRCNDYG